MVQRVFRPALLLGASLLAALLPGLPAKPGTAQAASPGELTSHTWLVETPGGQAWDVSVAAFAAPTLLAARGGQGPDLTVRPDPGLPIPPPPVPPPGEKPPEPPPPPPRRALQGTYRVAWRREGAEPKAPAGEIEQELTATWRDERFTLHSQWKKVLATEGSPPPADGQGIAVRLSLDHPPWEAVAGSSVRFGMRPLPSGDPFRLFYAPSGDQWRWSLDLQAADVIPWRGGPWRIRFHRAEGSPREDEVTWWQTEGEVPGRGVRWRWTGLDGSRRGSAHYRAWAADGQWEGGWGRLTGGYAQRWGLEDGALRGAGFVRWDSRRSGPWTARVEVYRRDPGFRLPQGGDLPWKEGTQGVAWRLRYSRSPWEGLWEEKVTARLRGASGEGGEGESPGAGAFREPAYQVTWRPARTWSLRLRYEVLSEGERERYEAQIRWPRQGVSFLGRYDLPDKRWRWRLEHSWGARRARLDWDDLHRAWRVEYRREWPRYHFRIVYKTRRDPSGAPGDGTRGGGERRVRQPFLFLEAGYRSSRAWGVSLTAGWDDRGRMDFHWNKPPRWELAWHIDF